MWYHLGPGHPWTPAGQCSVMASKSPPHSAKSLELKVTSMTEGEPGQSGGQHGQARPDTESHQGPGLGRGLHQAHPRGHCVCSLEAWPWPPAVGAHGDENQGPGLVVSGAGGGPWPGASPGWWVSTLGCHHHLTAHTVHK